jgi:hypothetical protein
MAPSQSPDLKEMNYLQNVVTGKSLATLQSVK